MMKFVILYEEFGLQRQMFIFHDEIRHIFMKNLACRGKCSYFMMKFVIFYEEFGLQRQMFIFHDEIRHIL